MNTHLAPAFSSILLALIYVILISVFNTLMLEEMTIPVWIGVGACFAVLLVSMTATLASPAERWFQMLRDIDTPRTILALQQKTHALPSGASPLGPTPDIMSHLYRNPAGIRCMGTLVTTALVTRIALAAALPMIALLLNVAVTVGQSNGAQWEAARSHAQLDNRTILR